jgi:hypothetical protein
MDQVTVILPAQPRRPLAISQASTQTSVKASSRQHFAVGRSRRDGDPFTPRVIVVQQDFRSTWPAFQKGSFCEERSEPIPNGDFQELGSEHALTSLIAGLSRLAIMLKVSIGAGVCARYGPSSNTCRLVSFGSGKSYAATNERGADGMLSAVPVLE